AFDMPIAASLRGTCKASTSRINGTNQAGQQGAGDCRNSQAGKPVHLAQVRAHFINCHRRDDGGREHGWREVTAAALSPPTGFNRLAFGERFDEVFASHDPVYFGQLALGVRTSTNNDTGPSGAYRADHDHIVRTEARFTLRVHRQHALALRYLLSRRITSAPATGDADQSSGSVGLYYVYLGNHGFGAVDWRDAAH
ncbi:MAG: hypothetical protein ABI619_10800, partial [Betaproteobacteria bacterium]